MTALDELLHLTPVVDLKAEAAAVAAEMLSFAEKYKDVTTAPDANQIRLKNVMMNADVRQRFIRVRAELFRRGIFDPILARFDSYTVAPADAQAVGQELAILVEKL